MNDSDDPVSGADIQAQYDSLTQSSGFVKLPNRCFVSMTGEDRQKLLHSFCTNDIKKLTNGDVCEAFVLNTKGKLLGHVHAIAADDELLLTGHGDQSSTLIEHLDKYVIREDVEMSVRDDELSSIFACGDKVAEGLAKICGELPGLNQFTQHQTDSISFKLVRIELAGPGFLIICDASSIDELALSLSTSGIKECSSAALEIVRIEACTPWFGIDADDSNLPQELQRDEIAISFDKGCYLGQETVARIDARGRVNQLLTGFRFTGDSTPPLGEFSHDEKTAGRITSFAQLPTSNSQTASYIAMGYVRRQFQDPGTQLGDWVVLDENS